MRSCRPHHGQHNHDGEVIRERTGRKAAIIDDPFEGPLGQPQLLPARAGERSEACLVWASGKFRHDLGDAAGVKCSLREQPLELHLVTDLNAAKQSPLLGELQRAVDQRLQLRLTPGLAGHMASLGAMRLGRRAKFASVKKLVKSPNRAMSKGSAPAISVGLSAPFLSGTCPGLWLGDDMAAGIRTALADPQAALETIAAGQSIIARRFFATAHRAALGSGARSNWWNAQSQLAPAQ